MTHESGSGPRDTRVTLFCSGAENIGQTTTQFNVARLMAAAGRRVLIVDLHRSDAHSHRYLRSRLRGVRAAPVVREPARQSPLPEPVEWALPVDDRSVRLSVLELRGSASAARLPTAEEAAGSAVYAGFDTVLIDAPVPRTYDQIRTLAPLAHVLATCFTPNSWSVDAAARLAREVREQAAGRPLDVVAVGLQVDSSLNEQLRLARDHVRTAFRELGGEGAAQYVEIPHDPLYDQNEAPQRRASAAGAAEPEPAEPQLTAPRRDGFVRLFEALDRPRSGSVRRVTLVHPPRYVAWAEWIGAQLSGAGVQSTTVRFAELTGERPARGSMLLVLSPTGATAEQTQLLTLLSDPNVRILLVDDEPLPAGIGHHEQIDLRALGEAEAVAQLRRALRLPASAPARSLPQGFPRLPARHNLAPRSATFTGHDRFCAQLRAHFAPPATRYRPCLLSGPPGIGKSALALEFCYRFGGSYQTVWWLRAADRADIERGLVLLAERLGLDFGERANAQDVLAWLRSPDSGLWLLVYDDADDPAALTGLLPEGGEGRHVLLTSRNAEVADAESVEVPPLTAEESRSLLVASVPGLDATRADQVGQIMGRAPLTVALAGAWIGVKADRLATQNQPRAEALRAAADQLVEAFSATQQDLLARLGQVPLHRVMLEATLAELGSTAGGELWARAETGSAGLLWLLECCALLTTSDVELALLRSPALRAALAGGYAPAPEEPAPRPGPPVDPLMIDVALWTLARHGLLDFHFGRPEWPVRQNRVLRELILERMEEAEREKRGREVRAVVAGHSFGGAEAADASDDPAVIDARTRRLMSLRLWADDRPEVRQALVKHLADLADTSERHRLHEVLDIGGLAAQGWKSQPLSMEYLRLHNLTAKAHRQLGEMSAAGRDALVALRGHRTALGVGHPRALLSADSYAAILRADGEFSEARIEGRGVVGSMTQVVGPDHSSTAQTEHNLALSEGLCGDYRTALERLRRRYTRRRTIGGPDDPDALSLLDAMALMHRGLGQNRESFDLLKQYLHRGGGRTDADSLNVEIGLAVSERRLGLVKSALERDRRVLDECRIRFGDRRIRTERCRFSLAADLHEVSDHQQAVTEIRTCELGLERTLGEEHPYTHLCRVRVGVHLRALGDLHSALRIGREALAQLRVGLGPDHPWVAAAEVAVAGTLVADGQYEEAYEKETSALFALDELGMAQHPDRALVARNRGIVDALRTGSTPDPATHQDIDLELPGL